MDLKKVGAKGLTFMGVHLLYALSFFTGAQLYFIFRSKPIAYTKAGNGLSENALFSINLSFRPR
jgi:hypothetical protein